jgi:hypothetical protein
MSHADSLRIDPWVDVDGALGVQPGEKPDLESLPLDERAPVPDVLPSNLIIEEVEIPLGLRPKPAVLGVSVPIEEHRPAFRRKKYPGVVEKVETVQTPPPLVPKRTATPDEVPAEAQRAADALAARGLQAWVTFAQGGTWRRWRDRGECVTCRATPMVMAEEKRDLESGAVLQAHNRPRRERCPGGSTDFRNGAVVCAACGVKPKRLNKSGSVAPHDRPLEVCPDQRASRMIPGDPRPPVTSIAVRALPHTGVAVWMTEPGSRGVEGKFDLAYVVHGRRLVKSSAAEFQRACRGEI